MVPSNNGSESAEGINDQHAILIGVVFSNPQFLLIH
jgi:hypothetical protein